MVPFSTPLTSSTPSSAHPSARNRVQITRVLGDGAIVDEDRRVIGHQPRPAPPLSLSGSRQSRPRTTGNQSTHTRKRGGSSSASQQKRNQRRATERERDRGGVRAEHTKIYNGQTTLHVLKSQNYFYILKLPFLLSNQEFPDIILEQMFLWNDLKAERRLTMQKDKAGY